ncbi:MAG: glycerol kinase GlpK [Bacteroidales bacterium]|jgi:glycerol kinase|nr:glycerol kinase GlpK [Bacteroidales bacterium]
MAYIISVDQSTQSTKAFLFAENGKVVASASREHAQIYPREGWVEHDPELLYANTVAVIREVAAQADGSYSLALTNQRETVVVWNRKTGKPVCNAVVWQCMRGKDICDALKAAGHGPLVKERTGLLIDPYFSASGVKWILDNVSGAREAAEQGDLLMGNVDCWLIWKLTGGAVHATDYTNASRTLLFNIHSLDWDAEMLRLFTIPRSMLPQALPCDAVFGQTTVEGAFTEPVPIAGVLGDSHGALVGQMCLEEGLGKATYGTGSSVMVNIGEKYADAPEGLVTSVGFAALGKVFYGFEGNIHCTGATITWLKDKLGLIDSPAQIEAVATSVPDNGGVYFIPAFAGLGAPWWHPEVRAQICGMTLGSSRAHVCRAALESIGYQVADLVKAMTDTAGIALREIRVDGGPTRNRFLMQFQSDLLGVPVVRSEVEDASAFGAFVVNGFALGRWNSFAEALSVWKGEAPVTPHPDAGTAAAYAGWRAAVNQLIK